MLSGYLNRIGFAGELRPDAEVLAQLHHLHPQAIPFENLDQITGASGSLELPAICDKLVGRPRGGWCYEQNQLFGAVLEAIGFQVEWRLARVMWNRPSDSVSPPLHFVLAVAPPQGPPYLADVGFGGLTMTGPLRLDAEGEQATPHEDFRVRRVGPDRIIEASVGGDWKPLYRVGWANVEKCDLAVCDFYMRNSRSSPFSNSIVAARVVGAERRVLHSDQFKRYAPGSEQSYEVESGELTRVLDREFGIRLEPGQGAALVQKFEALKRARTDRTARA